MKRLETALECRNALYEALDLVKAVQAATIRGVVTGHALENFVVEARGAIDQACQEADEAIRDEKRAARLKP